MAQLYSVAEASKNETGGGEGIEVVHNHPYENGEPLLGDQYTCGQYTYKIYHLQSRVPGLVKAIAPKGSLDIAEEAWNAYPYCRTVVTNPGFMKEHFYIKIETMHYPDNGSQHNIHQLTQENLAKRTVKPIDIAFGKIRDCDYKPEWDPKLVRSEKAGRGPINNKNWQNTTQPIMCAYKLVTAHFKWWGLQKRIENFIMTAEERIFTNFHRQVYCWMDKWFGLTMEDIRRLEEETKKELDEQRTQGEVRGTRGED